MAHNYITATEVKDKTINDLITRAGWLDTDIDLRIDEAENYVEARLIKLGYTRADLQTAVLVDTICINYSRYAVLRDIYQNRTPSPSQSPEMGYNKWKEWVDEVLSKIESNEIRLTTSTGVIISPSGGDSRFAIDSTTKNVKRIMTLDDGSTWTVDDTNIDESVVGLK